MIKDLLFSRRRRRRRKFPRLLGLFVILMGGVSWLLVNESIDVPKALHSWLTPEEERLGPAQVAGVVRYVIDGDTLILEGETRHIRIWGVNAPETDEAGGDAATLELKRLALFEPLNCQRKDIDRYGRIVALCRLPDGSDIARQMLDRGHVVEMPQYSKGYYSK